MTPKYFIGVDISKATLDFTLLFPYGDISSYKNENSQRVVKDLLATLKNEIGFRKNEVIIPAEDMRVEGKLLLKAVTAMKYLVYLESTSNQKVHWNTPWQK